MAQTGFTPIQIYSSSTAAAAPTAGNLANTTLGSELAINITDGKLFYKDNANAIQVIGWKVVPAVAGGTGQTSYAVGDILFANTSTTLAKLADVATGNALISGGVGVAPAYGKIGLTTHVTGVLPVANGGTNASTAGIASFNNITGYTASGATGTTSTNLVFSTSPSITTPTLVGDVTLSTGNLIVSTLNKGLNLPYAAVKSSNTSGDFIITVSGLSNLSGSVWRKSSMLVYYSGIDGTVSNSTDLLTIVELAGLSTYGATVIANIVGTAVITTANATSNSIDVTFDVSNSNAGSVLVYLLGGAEGSAPQISIAP
jgi:hypothetical protein